MFIKFKLLKYKLRLRLQTNAEYLTLKLKSISYGNKSSKDKYILLIYTHNSYTKQISNDSSVKMKENQQPS